MKNMGIKYNNRQDENKERVALGLGKLSPDKLKMLDIKFIEVVQGGPIIFQLDADGLVDKYKDWILDERTLTGSGMYTLRLANLKEDTPNKELLESLNYNWINYNSFGFIEVGRRTPTAPNSYGNEKKVEYNDGNEYLTCEHRVVTFDRNGNIISDTVSDFERALIKTNYTRGQFISIEEYKEHIGNVRAVMLDSLLKQKGYNSSKVTPEVEFDVNNGYLDKKYGMELTEITCFEHINGYNIAHMGKLNDNNASFLVYKKFEDIKAYGRNTVTKVLGRSEWECLDCYYGANPFCMVAEDVLVVADVINKRVLFLEEEIPYREDRKNMFKADLIDWIVKVLVAKYQR